MQVYNRRHWPHQFRMTPEPDAWEQACRLEAYCIDTFERNTWRSNGLYFAFKNQEDATLFLLKWSS
jgi:hypothetical protein